MWDLPGPGMKPTSPALAGRCLTTEPSGDPLPEIHTEYEHTTQTLQDTEGGRQSREREQTDPNMQGGRVGPAAAAATEGRCAWCCHVLCADTEASRGEGRSDRPRGLRETTKIKEDVWNRIVNNGKFST